MKIVITIDVEEDNWGEYTTDGYSLENIKKIQKIQKIFDRFNVKPTYLINYPVATDEFAVDMFRSLWAEGKCEIGAHCHPWNTPPFEEELGCYNSILCNLPEELQYRKLKVLKNTICENLGIIPVSFRAGRWAFNNSVARSLYNLGFKIDTSVTPYTEWSEWHGMDYSNCTPYPYHFSFDNIFKPSENGELLQVPASIGFLQKNYARCNWLFKLTDSWIMKKVHLRGVLSRLKILNKVFLSPEMSTGQEMIDLAERMKSLGFPILNLFFHSTTLLPGCSPFVNNSEEKELFLQNITQFLEYVTNEGIESTLLKDAQSNIQKY